MTRKVGVHGFLARLRILGFLSAHPAANPQANPTNRSNSNNTIPIYRNDKFGLYRTRQNNAKQNTSNCQAWTGALPIT
ncbi:hypothetical protein F5Y08DRAFT_296876 [Xylaria arbuscula]|nr:hypothetical protein F5Y08DRAFT_296876 [Xylaria arbuscula]